jgi:hypothetical protein
MRDKLRRPAFVCGLVTILVIVSFVIVCVVVTANHPAFKAVALGKSVATLGGSDACKDGNCLGSVAASGNLHLFRRDHSRRGMWRTRGGDRYYRDDDRYYNRDSRFLSSEANSMWAIAVGDIPKKRNEEVTIGGGSRQEERKDNHSEVKLGGGQVKETSVYLGGDESSQLQKRSTDLATEYALVGGHPYYEPYYQKVDNSKRKKKPCRKKAFSHQ